MTDMNQHLDEGRIHAWLDGALPPDESARVEAHAGSCADCAALVAEARGLVAASSRILSSLDDVPGGVIPGSAAGTDQLAVLRARRSAATRRWWRDRRIVAAASLLFVAGVTSVMLRSSADQSTALRTEQTVQAPPALPESVTPGSSGQGATPAAARESPAREAKVQAGALSPAPSPVRVAATEARDSTAEQKAAAASTSFARGSALAANETRRTDSSSIGRDRQVLDSLSEASRVAQGASLQNQVRQQGAAPQRQTFEQARADAARPAVPPAAFGAGASLGPVVTTGVGASMADALSIAGACYQLQMVLENGRASAAADTVQLLDEIVPQRSDPQWRRAQRINASLTPAVLTWRELDSAMVELRIVSAMDSTIVRFGSANIVVTGRRGEVIVRPAERPDVRRVPGIHAAFALRIDCPR